jgi:hypothetical protein
MGRLQPQAGEPPASSFPLRFKTARLQALDQALQAAGVFAGRLGPLFPALEEFGAAHPIEHAAALAAFAKPERQAVLGLEVGLGRRARRFARRQAMLLPFDAPPESAVKNPGGGEIQTV